MTITIHSGWNTKVITVELKQNDSIEAQASKINNKLLQEVHK